MLRLRSLRQHDGKLHVAGILHKENKARFTDSGSSLLAATGARGHFFADDIGNREDFIHAVFEGTSDQLEAVRVRLSTIAHL